MAKAKKQRVTVVLKNNNILTKVLLDSIDGEGVVALTTSGSPQYISHQDIREIYVDDPRKPVTRPLLPSTRIYVEEFLWHGDKVSVSTVGGGTVSGTLHKKNRKGLVVLSNQRRRWMPWDLIAKITASSH